MNDKLNERLSALMDGEDADTEGMISLMQQDQELRQRWMRYHMIRDALHNQLPQQLALNLAEQVSDALADEPAILAPQSRRRISQVWMKPAAGFALAATIATVAILSIQPTIEQPAGVDLATAAPVTGVQQVSAAPQDLRLPSAVERKLSGYLVNHNEYSVSSNMQGVMPYTRIVSFTKAQRVEGR